MGTRAQLRRRNVSVDEWDIYTRISKAPNGDVVKTDRQERLCRQMAAKLGLKIGKVWCDPNLSAWKPDRSRPAWDELLEKRIAAGQVKGVLFFHDDRILRHPDDCGALIRSSDEGGGIYTKSYEGPDHDLTDPSHVKALYDTTMNAWYEVARTAQRVSATLLDLRAGGVPLGPGAVFGYHRAYEITDRSGRVVKRQASLCPLPEEAAVLREIAGRVVAGDKWRALADELNERGVRTARGGRWTNHQLRVTVGLSRHGGIVRYYDVDGTPQEAVIPRPDEMDELSPGEPWPVLDAETFANLQAHIAGARRGRQPSIRRLLSGIIRCDRCKAPIYGCTQRGPQYGTREQYRCNRCRANSILSEPVDELVTAAVLAWYEREAPTLADRASEADTLLAQKRERVATLERNIDVFYAKKSADWDSAEIEQMEAMQIMKASLRRATAALASIAAPERRAADYAEDAAARWATGLVAQRRMVQAAVRVLSLVPTGRRGGNWTVDLGRVILEMR